MTTERDDHENSSGALRPPDLPYAETQHYAAPWLVIALAAMALVGISMAAGALAADPAENDAERVAGVLIGAVLAVGLPLVLATARLVTEVTREGVRVRLAPFQRRGRRYTWPQVAAFSSVRYRPLREFGGWGIRGTRRHGAYNARGDRGVRLVLADGATFLVGSQEPERLETAIAAATGRSPGLAGLVPADKEMR